MIRRGVAKELSLVFAGALISASTVSVARAGIIPAGTDYIATTPGSGHGGGGTFFDLTLLGLGAGIVDLRGNPLGGNLYDTVIRREAANVSGPTPGPRMDDPFVPIELLQLELRSVDPILLPGYAPGFFDVFVSLSPINPSLGHLAIRHENDDGPGPTGTFDSFFDVFFELTFEPVVPGPPLFIPNIPPQSFSMQNGVWTHGNGAFQFNFGSVDEIHLGGGGAHRGIQTIPAPAAALLGICGFGMIGWIKRRIA